MITRLVAGVVLGSVALGWAAETQAEDWICKAMSHIAKETKRRNCWPDPFVAPDRQSVRAPFAMMVQNGWRRQNMLSDYHFEPDTGALTEAGRLKIRWILREAPSQHRLIYVHTADSPEQTAARVDQVQQVAAAMVHRGDLPPVLETDIPDQGWPASQVDIIGRKFEASIPDPRLPEASADSGSSN